MSSNVRVSRSVWPLVLVVSLALGTRLLLFTLAQPWNDDVERERIIASDAIVYHQLATTLLENHRFARDADATPEAIRTPFYPLFIAAIYSVVGEEPWAVLVVQLLLDAICCGVLYVLVSRLVGHRPAMIAAILYAFDPSLIIYSSTVLISDTFFVFLFLVFVTCLVIASIGDGYHHPLPLLLGAGVVLGLATLTRPTALYIAPILLALPVFWNRAHLVAAIKQSATVLVVAAIIVAPWLVRNYVVFDRVSLSPLGPYYFLVEVVAQMEAVRLGEGKSAMRAGLLDEADRRMMADGLDPDEIDQFKQSEYWQRLDKEYVSTYPLVFAKIYAVGVMQTFANVGTSLYANRLGVPLERIDMKVHLNVVDLVNTALERRGLTGLFLAVVLIPHFVISYTGALIGAIVWWQRYDRRLLLVLLLIVGYFVAVAGAGGDARFKLPVIPAYLALAGVGLSYLYDLARNRSRRPRAAQAAQVAA